MRQLLIVAAVATGGLGILWANAQERRAAAPAAAPAVAGDEAGVRAALAAYGTAQKTGDLNAILSFWAPDADFTDDSGEVVRGRDNIGKLFAANLADLKAGRSTVKLDSLRFLSPDVATLEGQVEFTPASGVAEVNRFSAVMTHRGNRWIIASARDLPETNAQTADRFVSELKWLVGEWHASDRGTTVTLTVKPELDGKFAFAKYDIKGPNHALVVYQMIGFDPVNGTLRSWIFDSRGNFGEAEWARENAIWSSDSTTVLATGQVGSSINSIQMLGPNQFKWRSASREVDGQPLPDQELTYTRAGASR